MGRLGRRSVTFKISLITGGLLVVCTILVFGIFYFLLPSFYHHYKVKALNGALDRLIENVSELTLQAAQPRLDAFTQQYNVWVGVQDQNNRIIYVPSIYSSRDGTSGLNPGMTYAKLIQIALPKRPNV